MDTLTKIIFTLILIAAIVLGLKYCKPNTIDVTIPAISGDFEKQTPIYINIRDTTYLTRWKTKDNTITVETENPVNQELVNKYNQAKDSIDKFKLYVNAVQLKDFTSHFEDTAIDLSIIGQVQGDIKYIKPSYTIKEKKVPVTIPDKKAAFRILFGTELRSNTKQLDYNLNVGFQTAKGNIYRVGYSKQADGNYIMVGYDLSIFAK